MNNFVCIYTNIFVSFHFIVSVIAFLIVVIKIMFIVYRTKLYLLVWHQIPEEGCLTPRPECESIHPSTHTCMASELLLVCLGPGRPSPAW